MLHVANFAARLLLLLTCLFADSLVAVTRVNILTILNHKSFPADQQVFARALNQKNQLLQTTTTSSYWSLHSTEIAAKSGLATHLQELCAAAENAPNTWLAIVNLAESASVFASAMVAQRWALPVLGYVNTLQAEMFRDAGPDSYIPLNAGLPQLAQAVAHFVITQRWQNSTGLVHDTSHSSTVFRAGLKSAGLDLQDFTSVTSESSARIHANLARIKETVNRVHVIFCEPALTRIIFDELTKLHLTGPGWVWIITDRSFTTEDDVLQAYPIGTFAVKSRELSLGAIVKRALDGVVLAAAAVSETVVSRLQDKRLRKLDCFGAGSGQVLSGQLEIGMKNFTRNLTDFARAPLDGASFEILALTEKKLRHRWAHVGNISTAGTHPPAVTLAGDRLRNLVLQPREKLRVATRISHPFVIEDYPFTDDGDCPQIKCLRINAKTIEEFHERFTNYQTSSGAQNDITTTCCKGLAIELLQAIGRDVEFDFDIYLVPDDKDGTHLENGVWDGIIGDITSGAAHMGIGPITVTQARKTAVDFSSPFFYSKFSFLVAVSKTKIKLSAFLEPFSWKLWISIFSALHATAIAAAIFEWFSPFGLNPRGRMRSQNFTLATALTTVYSLFFSHVMAFKAPKSWPNKVLINFWGSFCFIILASYTANHAAIYAGLSQKPNFDDIFDNEDLLQRKVATIQGSSAEVFIRNINKDLHHHMKMRGFFNVVSIDDAVQKLKNGSLDAFVYDTALLEYVQANDTGCSLKTAGASFGSQGYAVAFPRGSRLRVSDSILEEDHLVTIRYISQSNVSNAILKYMENGFVDELNAKYFSNLQCKPTTLDTHEPRALGLEDFAGVFVLLAVGGAVGLLILGLEHVVYRLLPILRRAPKTSCWHSRHVMFFSQKLYRFINSVDLVSPNSSAKEFASSLKQGQFIGMFQKSVKKRAKEEAMQAKRTRNADNFFETIHELTRNLRESSVQGQFSLENPDGTLTEPQASQTGNGDLQPESSLYRKNSALRKAHFSPRIVTTPSKQLNRQDRVSESEDDPENFARSFPELQKSNMRNSLRSGTASLNQSLDLDKPKKLWIAQKPTVALSEEDLSPADPPERSPLPSIDELHPYTSLRDWEDVDIDDVSKQDLIKMWQSAECDLRLRIQKLERERSGLLESARIEKDARRSRDSVQQPSKAKKSVSMML